MGRAGPAVAAPGGGAGGYGFLGRASTAAARSASGYPGVPVALAVVGPHDASCGRGA
jgi:hypothetical protein